MILFAATFILFVPVISANVAPTLPGNCTLSYINCDPLAICEVIPDTNSFKCICSGGSFGDGLQGDGRTGCKYTEFPCTTDDNCHPNGNCNKTNPAVPICVCNEGSIGDGKHKCEDIDECLTKPCDPHAHCQNTSPGFSCVCLPLFTGDGFTCTRTCTVKHDCAQPNGDCVDNYCQCKPGYQGDAVNTCDDIDECKIGEYVCAQPATCVNTDGSYDCACPNGYKEERDTCIRLPVNCDEIYRNMPEAVSGRTYDIDPDSTGPLAAMKAKCEFINGIGITIVIPVHTEARTATSTKQPIDYIDATPESIKGLVDNSKFCYQTQWIECYAHYNLHDRNIFEWTDAVGNVYKSWGGSGVDGKCACGALGFCDQGAACNCDGSTAKKAIDFGKIIDRSRLPVTSVKFRDGSTYRRAEYIISELKCAPKPIDLLRDCDALKDVGVEDDGPQVIDIDGPDGELEPTLVHCDMNTYDHVGITVLPHDKQTPIVPTESGTNPLTYVTPDDTISGIISGSAYCYQEIKYSCRNAPIHMNGQQVVFVSVGNNSKQIDYFPGAQGVPNTCGCGIIGSCSSKDVKCNCDMNDNETRYDIGVQTNSDDLPIVSITADASDPDSYIGIEIGPLMCAKAQFGIEPNCEKYRATGRVDAYAYLIDPDGPKDPKKPNELNVAPFTAECQFTDYPPQGVTIIHHDSEDTFSLTAASFVFQIAYRQIISDDQLRQLKNRATFCVQSLTFDCQDYHLHLADGHGGLVWKDIDGNEYSYLSGGLEGDDGCKCNAGGNCRDAKICNCDAVGNGLLQDAGELANVTHLPVAALDFTSINSQLSGGNSSLAVTLGPLKCYETFRTCYDLWAYMRTNSLIGERPVESGKYTIDPDTSGGVSAFTVTCNFPFTVVPVSPGTQYGPGPGQSKCFDVNYSDTNGNPISKEQISALVANSKACQQYLSYSCKNAPKTGHVNYSSCDGVAQTGWSLSGGFDTCSCGLTGTCLGGPSQNCNCDTEDGVTRKDGGYIYNTTRLPVCEVCMSVDGIDPANPPPGGNRMASFHVGSLNCLGYEFGGRATCEDRRLYKTKSDIYYTDPDAKYGGVEPFPVYCSMNPYPAMGIMIIIPKETEFVIPENQGFDITITYFVYSQEDIEKLIDNSYYCTQEISIICNSGSLDLSGANGWYSRAGDAQNSWGGNIGDGSPCEGAGANCNCNIAGSQIDGGILGDKSLLPISRVKLGASPTERTLRVGPVKCYEIKRDCYDIMKSGNTKTPYRNSTYVIDPDGPDGVDPFIVKCHFDKRNDNAVTEVLPETSIPELISGKVDPLSYKVPYEYRGATPEQINALTRQAPFCHQGILYECTESPISGAVQVNLNDGTPATSFGTGSNTNSIGCPCNQLGTCGEFKCRCDAKGSMMPPNDNGTITDRTVLPITSVNVGGQIGGGASSTVTVSSVRCSERPVDFPRDCEDAYVRGYRTGEVMIYPSSTVQPFFVFCDMEINPGHGVAIINPDFQPDTTIPYDGTPIDVPYKGPTDEQIKALVKISSNCYQPIKYNCKATKFLTDNKFSWTSLDGGNNTYFGAGTQANTDCTCGDENMCGGDGGKTEMQKRDCNCDIGDDQSRSDAGVFKNTQDLPIKNLKFQSTGVSGSEGSITVGQLFCGQSSLAIDECSTGFHDCHEKANCLDTLSGFECVCQKGWQGRGRSGVWANGRECYDDNECSFLPCPQESQCNNLPGSYNCTCDPGYYQRGPYNCEDINECTEGTHNCDDNARCTNTIGSFFCTCKRGFRGKGTNQTCEAIGICACFGDPHCISFDTRWLHFMGECQYTMAQDGCDGSPQTFAVLTQNWNMDRRDIQGVSWVKDVTVIINNTRINLGRNREIRVDGRTSVAYYNNGISVDDNGREVTLKTSFGLEVYWDGKDEVEVILPKEYKQKTCGLCGNFNGDSDDDFIIGDHCDAKKGQQTDNDNLFGNSWVVTANTPSTACSAPCDTPPTNNTVCSQPLFNYYCDKVFDPTLSPFRTCLLAMDELLLQQLRFSCMFDLCHVSQDVELGMCSSAERVVNECQKNSDIAIGVWRKPGFCEMTCSGDMEYRICGPRGEPDKTVQSTCSNTRLNTEPANMGVCSEGCFCKPGFVREANRCVEPVECGCIFEGVYMPIGATYVDPGCSKMQVCKENGVLSEQPLQCGQNSECVLNDDSGIYGCHCKKGFRGNGFICSDDPCFNITCSNNMECENGLCQCKMGYQGDCNTCADIDECATKTDDCVHIGQKCENFDGGFTCKCQDGYVKWGNYCQDINECEAGFDTCGDHTECINKHGGYICACCDGYKKNGLGNCVADSANPPVAGSTCCSCNGHACSRPGKVCGDNGKTYNNERALITSSCMAGTGVDVSYRGECKANCDGVQCDRPFEKCSVDPSTNIALCECPKCGGGETPETTESVCSSRFITFPSKCEFERIMCEVNDPLTVIQEDKSLCDKGSGVSPVGPWTEWSECDVDCGPGKMKRTRAEGRSRTGYEKLMFVLEQTATCYGNCTTGPCAGYTCTGFGEVCVPSNNDTEADCICPNCEHREDEPVCGLVGLRQISFKNKCELQKKACELKKKPHLLSESACGALPLNCSLYAKHQDFSEGDCAAGNPMPVGQCEGGCGVNPDKCCESIKQEDVHYTLTCANGTTVDRQVSSVLNCKCKDLIKRLFG